VLSDNARTGKTPWIWDGNADSPTVYELMITIAVETDELMSSSVNDMGTGEAAREYFMDGGNGYRPAQRINAVFPVDGDGHITTNNPVGTTKLGTPAAPNPLVDRQAALDAELKYRLKMKNAVVIRGDIHAWGMRFDPWPIGYLLGNLTVPESEEQTRVGLALNACIRGFHLTRNPPMTRYTLDGR